MDNINKPYDFSTHEQFLPLYFQKEYINVHRSSNIRYFQDRQFTFIASLTDDLAYSFRQSPFGSFFIHQPANFDQFSAFEQDVTSVLTNNGISKIRIRHAPEYYSSFIESKWLNNSGYQLITSDVNQFLDLNDSPESHLHKMETRKLNRANQEGLLFKKESITAVKEIHSFIALCRADAGLSVNISLDKLKSLFEAFPLYYGLYSVRKDKEILAACVVSKPVQDIYYYYLPATHPDHRSKSPMVLLLLSLAELFKSNGARIFDLGLSSIDGEKQSGLYDFKRRMGAKETSSLLFEKIIG